MGSEGTILSRRIDSGSKPAYAAEMYEKPDAGGLMCEDPIMEALDCYQLAADYYKNESPPREVATNNMLQKVATLSAQKGELPRAAEIFDEMARGYLDSKMLKFNAVLKKCDLGWTTPGPEAKAALREAVKGKDGFELLM